MTVAEKKKMYGSQRIPIGGRSDTDEKSKARRMDTDVEPMSFHSLPLQAASYFNELTITLN